MPKIMRIMEKGFRKSIATRGSKHDFLVLRLGFGEDKALRVGVKYCLKKALENFRELTSPASNPDKNNPFDANGKSPKQKSDVVKNYVTL